MMVIWNILLELWGQAGNGNMEYISGIRDQAGDGNMEYNGVTMVTSWGL